MEAADISMDHHPSSPSPPQQKLFAPITYYIASSFPPQHIAELDAVLQMYGATRVDRALGVRDERLTTVIANSVRWEGWEVLARRESEAEAGGGGGEGEMTGEGAQGAEGKRKRKVDIVTDKWVERSLLLGKLQSAQHFSVDPALIFSGVVACATSLPPTDLEVLSAGITALGGQWRTGLTKDVTHLFALSPGSAKYSTAMHHREDTGVKVVLPHWFDDAVRLGVGSLDTACYEWPEVRVLKGVEGILGAGAGKEKGKGKDVVMVDGDAATVEKDEVKRNMYATAALFTPEMGRSSPPAEGDISLVAGRIPVLSRGPGGGATGAGAVQVWAGRKILLSRTLQLYRGRREAVQVGIERAGGIVVRFEGDEEEEELEEGGFRLSAKEKERRRKEAEAVGECDVLVTRWRFGRAYVRAVRETKTIGTLAWLFHVQSTGILSRPVDQLLHYPIPKRPIESFSHHVITVTNYTGEAREYLKKLINTMGAEFTPSMSGQNTILIAAYTTGTKSAKATSWSIPVVNHTWLEDCFVQWRNLTPAVEKYIVFPAGVDFSRLLGERGVFVGGVGSMSGGKDGEREGDRGVMGQGRIEMEAEEVEADGEEELADEEVPPPGTEASMKEVQGLVEDRDRGGDGAPHADVDVDVDMEWNDGANEKEKENLKPAASAATATKKGGAATSSVPPSSVPRSKDKEKSSSKSPTKPTYRGFASASKPKPTPAATATPKSKSKAKEHAASEEEDENEETVIELDDDSSDEDARRKARSKPKPKAKATPKSKPAAKPKPTVTSDVSSVEDDVPEEQEEEEEEEEDRRPRPKPRPISKSTPKSKPKPKPTSEVEEDEDEDEEVDEFPSRIEAKSKPTTSSKAKPKSKNQRKKLPLSSDDGAEPEREREDEDEAEPEAMEVDDDDDETPPPPPKKNAKPSKTSKSTKGKDNAKPTKRPLEREDSIVVVPARKPAKISTSAPALSAVSGTGAGPGLLNRPRGDARTRVKKRAGKDKEKEKAEKAEDEEDEEEEKEEVVKAKAKGKGKKEEKASAKGKGKRNAKKPAPAVESEEEPEPESEEEEDEDEQEEERPIRSTKTKSKTQAKSVANANGKSSSSSAKTKEKEKAKPQPVTPTRAKPLRVYSTASSASVSEDADTVEKQGRAEEQEDGSDDSLPAAPFLLSKSEKRAEAKGKDKGKDKGKSTSKDGPASAQKPVVDIKTSKTSTSAKTRAKSGAKKVVDSDTETDDEEEEEEEIVSRPKSKSTASAKTKTKDKAPAKAPTRTTTGPATPKRVMSVLMPALNLSARADKTKGKAGAKAAVSAGAQKTAGKSRRRDEDTEEEEEEEEVVVSKGKTKAVSKPQTTSKAKSKSKSKHISDEEPEKVNDTEEEEEEEEEVTELISPRTRGVARTESIRAVAGQVYASVSTPGAASRSTSKAQIKTRGAAKTISTSISAPPSKPKSKAKSKPQPMDIDGDSTTPDPSSIATGSMPPPAMPPPRRSAAAKATQRLHETIMPDVIQFEAQMRKAHSKARRGSSTRGGVEAFVVGGEEEERSGSTARKRGNVEEEEGDGKAKKKRRVSGVAGGDEDGVEEVEVRKDAKGKGKQKAVPMDVDEDDGSTGIMVMTTQVTLGDDTIKALTKLGVKMTTRANECTHLLARQVVRTEKFLCALASAPWILSEKWALASADAKRILPEKDFVLTDKAGENKYGVDLVAALRRAKANNGKMLAGHTFYVTPRVAVDTKLLKNVINACGGQVTTQSPTARIINASPETRHIISCKEDIAIWRPIAAQGIKVYNQELLLTGALKQEMEWEKEDFYVR